MNEHSKHSKKKKILFICTGNSCRSQMAEAFTNVLLGASFEAFSAGTHPKAIDPLAVEAMKELGIDISGYSTNHISEFLGESFDLVITVCDSAREECPYFPGARRMIHAGFEDPPYLARNAKSKDEAMQHYRRIRDEIKNFVLDKLPGIFES